MTLSSILFTIFRVFLYVMYRSLVRLKNFIFAKLSNLSFDHIDSTDTPHNIYIAKWTTIRMIGDLSKFKFDWIIVDNKGDTLNNNFCYSMLVKNFERQVNILISSGDITSDVKILYNILRLGGRLDPQYETYKIFLDKFKLPDSKEIAKNKLDLEDYYGKRAILCDLVKDFRLRRYRHQYESVLPLIETDQYNMNLKEWLEGQQAKQGNVLEIIDSSNSTVSGIAVERKDDKGNSMESGINDNVKNYGIFNKYDPTPSQLRIEEPNETIEETEAMSPLLLLSDSESENVFTFPQSEAELCPSSNEVEIIENTLEKTSQVNSLIDNKSEESVKPTKKTNRKSDSDSPKKTSPSSFETSPIERRATRQRSQEDSNAEAQNKQSSEKKEKLTTNKRKLPSSKDTEDEAPSTSKKNKSSRSRLKEKAIEIEESDTETCKEKNENKSLSGSPDQKRIKEEYEITRRKIKKEKPEPMFRDTRCTRWSRTTRSTSNQNKAIVTNFILSYESDKKKRKSAPSKLETNVLPISEKRKRRRTPRGKENVKANKQVPKSSKKTTTTKKVENEKCGEPSPTRKRNSNDSVKGKTKGNSSQASVISTSSSFDDIQCGQRLDVNSDVNIPTSKATAEFLVPAAKTLSTPNMGLYSDSDLIIISPPSQRHSKKPSEIVVVSSSEDESAIAAKPSEFSRRTWALKPKKVINKNSASSAQSRAFTQIHDFPPRDKSPDLFSTCSDLNVLSGTQKDPSNATSSQDTETMQPFGFKIFGSEVKQYQQKYAEIEASSQTIRPVRKNTRSCLNILENMFEPGLSRGTNSNSASTSALRKEPPTVVTDGQNKKQNPSKSKTKKPSVPIVPTHPIAAIEKNNQKKAIEKAAREAKIQAQNEAKQLKKASTRKTQSKRKPVVEETCRNDKQATTFTGPASLNDQSNDGIFEITNNSTFGSRLRLNSTGEVTPLNNQTSANPQQKTKQNNKITNYFTGNQSQSLANGRFQSTPPIGIQEEENQITPHKRPNSANSKKSPKHNKTPTQTTKLTRWLTKNGNNNDEDGGGCGTQSPTKKSPFKKAVELNMALQQAANKNGHVKNGKTNQRRRRLDMSKH